MSDPCRCERCLALIQQANRDRNSHARNQFIKDLEEGTVVHIRTENGKPVYQAR